MSASALKLRSVPGWAAHWAACLLSAALFGLFMVMAIGEGPPLRLLVDPQLISLLVMLAGFAIGWRNNLVGGVVSLAGIGTFYLLNYSTFGQFPGGWVFPLCFVPGVLLVLAALLRRKK